MPKFRPPTANEQAKRNYKIYELANKGINLYDIARVYGISRERVRQIVNRQQEKIEGNVEKWLSQRD